VVKVTKTVIFAGRSKGLVLQGVNIMSGEAQIVQPVPPVELPVIEKQQNIEQSMERNNSVRNQATAKISKLEDRFARLKKNLRKRSASIL
jgi:hypothetical protein